MALPTSPPASGKACANEGPPCAEDPNTITFLDDTPFSIK